MSSPKHNDFERAAREERHSGLLREFWGFLKDNKKWLMIPVIVLLLIFGLLIFLAGTGVAPFIYTLF
jgi:hypothetical protein